MYSPAGVHVEFPCFRRIQEVAVDFLVCLYVNGLKSRQLFLLDFSKDSVSPATYASVFVVKTMYGLEPTSLKLQSYFPSETICVIVVF